MSIGGTPNVRPRGRRPTIEETILNAQTAPSDDDTVSSSASGSPIPPRPRLPGVNGTAVGCLLGLGLAVLVGVIIVSALSSFTPSSPSGGISSSSSGYNAGYTAPATDTPQPFIPPQVTDDQVKANVEQEYQTYISGGFPSLTFDPSQIVFPYISAYPTFTSDQQTNQPSLIGSQYLDDVCISSFSYQFGLASTQNNPLPPPDSSQYEVFLEIITYVWDSSTSTWTYNYSNEYNAPSPGDVSNYPGIEFSGQSAWNFCDAQSVHGMYSFATTAS